jgi:N-acetylglutamate synthase-like GNAT family acetyltransferase
MEKLEFEEIEAIKYPLIQRFYKQHYPTAKPKRNEKTIIARAIISNEIVACVRFRQIEQYQLLTGMVVASEKRKQGLGNQLLAHCYANDLNPNVYCFAYTELEAFYRQHGFITCDADNLPPPLKVLFQRYTNSGKSLIPMQYL